MKQILSLLIALSCAANAQTRYAVTDLGRPGGPTNASYGAGINSKGDVIGEFTSQGGFYHGFLYKKGRITDLGLVPKNPLLSQVLPAAINDSDEIVGTIQQGFTSTTGDAFVWKDGKMSIFASVSAGFSAQPLGINNLGEIVGAYNSFSYFSEQAFLYQNGRITNLGTFGGAFSDAFGINNLGQIVGTSEDASGQFIAFIYSNGRMQPIPGVAGTGFYAHYINDHGQMAGFVGGGVDFYAAWYSGGMVRLLPALTPYASYTIGINNSGEILGLSATVAPSAGPYIFFLYKGGQMYDIATLINATAWKLYSVAAINDAEQIAATGIQTVNGAQVIHALLLNPVTNH
jgi:probable HAF family extracellular repeat protein